ncbi:MAG: YicC/YloC family endoribonuclease [Thermodesulfobacteriota bacterium]
MKRPLSMTAYGRGEAQSGSQSWTTEVRSVNHKFLDLNLKLPRKYLGLEDRIRKEIGSHYSRGHVDVLLTLGGTAAEAVRLSVNLELARDYFRCLEAIRAELNLADPPTLAMVKDFRDIIVSEEQEEDLEKLWPPVRESLRQALANALVMREQEGATLRHELETRLAEFGRTVDRIEQEIPAIVERRREKLKERLDTLLAGVELDPQRLTQEAAILADKTDVTEELVRLRSHIAQFNAFLAADEPVGRRLDFLLQEFLREINTLASKITDASTAHLSVELKNEVEKLREQVQNLE